MRVFVTGANGQLGHDVVNELISRGYEAIGSDITREYSGISDGSAVTIAPYAQLDITDHEQVDRALASSKVDAVIHCAAWTNVDGAEDPGNREKVFAINENGTRNIAVACKSIDCKMLYISTDYVFNGQGTEPWQPDDKNYAPLNVYGGS